MAPISTTPEYSREEVGLALRNPGMQLEGLRYPITPIGMHNLLIHFDIPQVDPATYELPMKGRVRNALKLSLEEIKARPKVTMPVMMECGGNGRTSLHGPSLPRGTTRRSDAPSGRAPPYAQSSRKLA